MCKETVCVCERRMYVCVKGRMYVWYKENCLCVRVPE